MEVLMGAKSHIQEPERAATAGGTGWGVRLASILRLARRDLLAALVSPALYLMVTLSCLVAAVVVKSYLDYVNDNGTLVLASPLKAPLVFAVLALTAYLGLLAAAGLAGERERGTLEVLFYGPVDSPTFVGGKLLGALFVYILAIASLAVFLALASLLSGMPLDAATLIILAASVLPAASMVALGLLLAALVGRVRPALALTLLAILLFFAIDAGNGFAATQPGDSLLGSAAGLLSALAGFVSWLSPFGYIWRAMDGLSLGDAAAVALDLGVALLYAAVLTGLAVAALRVKGVQRWRE